MTKMPELGLGWDPTDGIYKDFQPRMMLVHIEILNHSLIWKKFREMSIFPPGAGLGKATSAETSKCPGWAHCQTGVAGSFADLAAVG